MNKPYFCRNFFLIEWRHKRLKITIDLLLFYGELSNGFSESVLMISCLLHFNRKKKIIKGNTQCSQINNFLIDRW